MIEQARLRWLDRGCVAGLFALHLAHALARAQEFPNHRFDPDLLAYFTYLRHWLAHDPSLFGVSYFPHPKPLLVFTLGFLGNVSLAFCCSAVAAAILGSVLYVIGREYFGRTTGVLFSLLVLAHPSNWVLTLRSSADMYIALLLFSAIYCCRVERWIAASVLLFLSALVKPVTLPCTLYFLAADPRSKRAWSCALFPFLAIALTFWANQVLLGDPFGSESFLNEFAALRDAATIATADVLHFAFWAQLVNARFISTAPLGFLGALVWVARDRRRLTSPLLLLPLLFVMGYLLLSIASPFMPFFRFFWPLEIWFMGFLSFGIIETARRLACGQRWQEFAVAGLLVFFVATDLVRLEVSYREGFAVPFEESVGFVRSSRATLANRPAAGDHILAPLAFLPYLMWELDGAGSAVITAEHATVHGYSGAPEWILDVPDMYANPKTRDLVAELVKHRGYQVWHTDGKAALLALRAAPGVAAGATQ